MGISYFLSFGQICKSLGSSMNFPNGVPRLVSQILKKQCIIMETLGYKNSICQK